jgi:acyl-CoA dehydrogenase
VLRERLAPDIHVPRGDAPGLATLERALEAVVRAAPVREKLRKAQHEKRLARGPAPLVLEEALRTAVIGAEEAELVRAAERAREQAILVDAHGESRELAGTRG